MLTQKDVSLVTVGDSSEENIKRAKEILAKADLDLEANLEV
jgi:L-asparaginase II